MDPSKPSDMSGAPPPPPYVGPAQDYNAAPAQPYAAPAQPYAQQPPYAAQPYVAAPGQMDMNAPGADPTKGAVAMAPPMAGAPAPVGEAKFSTGLFDCCEGPHGVEGCLISWCVPCWAHGIVGDVVADGVGRVPPCSLTLGLYGIIWLGSCLAGVCRGVNVAFQVPAAIGFIVLAALGRKKMREKYGIPGNCCPGDCCTVYWCHCCALAQEMRHIRDHMPSRDFALLENREATRTDLDFINRALAPYFNVKGKPTHAAQK